ncbi:MAG: glycosyltransferase [Actinomycetota bacterium]
MNNWEVVCFSGVDWASHPRRSHWVARELAALGHTVTYVENLGTRPPRWSDLNRIRHRLSRALSPARRAGTADPSGVRVVTPLILPYQRSGLVRTVDLWSLRRRAPRRAPHLPLVVWTYLPMPVIRDYARSLGARFLVYDWCDDASVHMVSASASHRRQVAEWEDETASEADLVLFASEALRASRGASLEHAMVVAHGAAGKDLRRAVPPEVARLPRPRIGFVGSITTWTDLELVAAVAAARPEWTIVMVGPVRADIGPLTQRPNVILLGARPHSEISALLRGFDVGLIPYRISPATTVASPLKLQEYLANGLPVVSVDIPAAREAGVAIAENAEGFVAAIEGALEGPSQERSPVAEPRSWTHTVGDLVGLIEQRMAERPEERQVAGS